MGKTPFDLPTRAALEKTIQRDVRDEPKRPWAGLFDSTRYFTHRDIVTTRRKYWRSFTEHWHDTSRAGDTVGKRYRFLPGKDCWDTLHHAQSVQTGHTGR